MAGSRAPAPARECKLERGTPGKCYRDVLRAAAPGRNLCNWPFKKTIYDQGTGALSRPEAYSVAIVVAVTIMIAVMVMVAVMVVPPVPVALLIFFG